MELNYSSVKALSSPTRLKILKTILESPCTPTEISKEIKKSKSTVTDHLSKLVEAGLVEKDSKEGRRRVVYRPTTNAKVIARGSSRKVTFSIFSSALSTAVGIALVVHQFLKETGQDAVRTLEQDFAAETVPEMEEAAVQTLNPYLIALGVFLLLMGLFGTTYFYYFKKKIIDSVK